jgi:hypothetical protein
MDFLYTKHQTARGTRADAEIEDKLFLIKSPSLLRLTYQIRLLTHVAHSRGKKLVILVPKPSKIHDSLKYFIRENPELIKVERT